MIKELRIALTVDQFDQALRFYGDALGLEARQSWDGEQGRGAILELPRATLEILDRHQSEAVDRIEAGRVIPVELRLAVQLDDLEAATAALQEAGAKPVRESVHTPWGDHNRRVTTPDGRQMTLFMPESSLSDVPAPEKMLTGSEEARS